MSQGQGGGGQGGGSQVPSPSSANGKVQVFAPHTTFNKGDILLPTVGGSTGWWVCIRPHTSGQTFTLKANQSDNSWHWSTGPS